MKLKAVTPVVKEATEQVIYDHYWVVSMTISAPDPNKPVSVNARLAPAKDVTDGEGNVTKHLDYKNMIHFNVKDIFKRMSDDPTGPLAQAFGGIMVALIAEIPEIEA